MSDGYMRFAHSAVGKKICRGLGFPIPPHLQRANKGPQEVVKHILFSSVNQPNSAISNALADAALDLSVQDQQRYNGLIFDASSIASSTELKQLFQFFNQHLPLLQRNGRIVLIGLNPQSIDDTPQAIAQRSLLGFIKSLAKEVGRKGTTANLIYTEINCGNEVASPLRFFMSNRCTYVTGQVINVALPLASTVDWQQPLAGKTALVTGAARGIGADIAKVLARDGAKVIGLDIPQSQQLLNQVMNEINGDSLLVNVTDANAAELISAHIKQLGGGLDIIVHNAGITRDKTLARMKPLQWDLLIDINLTSIERINHSLLNQDLINDGGRIIGVSSISGIAGNPGQTNYATSKAGVIGMVESLAPKLAAKNITINAVAPGFIETEMTDAVPFMPRQLGRRLCSLSQGGLPVDVAETIAMFAAPNSQGITANIIRVCGQNIMGS